MFLIERISVSGRERKERGLRELRRGSQLRRNFLTKPPRARWLSTPVKPCSPRKRIVPVKVPLS
jgi:hypothetical protein